MENNKNNKNKKKKVNVNPMPVKGYEDPKAKILKKAVDNFYDNKTKTNKTNKTNVANIIVGQANVYYTKMVDVCNEMGTIKAKVNGAKMRADAEVIRYLKYLVHYYNEERTPDIVVQLNNSLSRLRKNIDTNFDYNEKIVEKIRSIKDKADKLVDNFGNFIDKYKSHEEFQKNSKVVVEAYGKCKNIYEKICSMEKDFIEEVNSIKERIDNDKDFPLPKKIKATTKKVTYRNKDDFIVDEYGKAIPPIKEKNDFVPPAVIEENINNISLEDHKNKKNKIERVESFVKKSEEEKVVKKEKKDKDKLKAKIEEKIEEKKVEEPEEPNHLEVEEEPDLPMYDDGKIKKLTANDFVDLIEKLDNNNIFPLFMYYLDRALDPEKEEDNKLLIPLLTNAGLGRALVGEGSNQFEKSETLKKIAKEYANLFPHLIASRSNFKNIKFLKEKEKKVEDKKQKFDLLGEIQKYNNNKDKVKATGELAKALADKPAILELMKMMSVSGVETNKDFIKKDFNKMFRSYAFKVDNVNCKTMEDMQKLSRALFAIADEELVSTLFDYAKVRYEVNKDAFEGFKVVCNGINEQLLAPAEEAIKENKDGEEENEDGEEENEDGEEENEDGEEENEDGEEENEDGEEENEDGEEEKEDGEEEKEVEDEAKKLEVMNNKILQNGFKALYGKLDLLKGANGIEEKQLTDCFNDPNISGLLFNPSVANFIAKIKEDKNIKLENSTDESSLREVLADFAIRGDGNKNVVDNLYNHLQVVDNEGIKNGLIVKFMQIAKKEELFNIYNLYNNKLNAKEEETLKEITKEIEKKNEEKDKIITKGK